MKWNFKTVNFDIQPTNPQADIVATGRCEYWITDVDVMKHQGNDVMSPSDDPMLPEVYIAIVACVWGVDKKCKGMLTPKRLFIFLRAFEKAKQSGVHDIHPPPMGSASELTGLITRKDIAASEHTSQKIRNSFSRMLPPHIITTLQKMDPSHVRKKAFSLGHDPTLFQYWS